MFESYRLKNPLNHTMIILQWDNQIYGHIYQNETKREHAKYIDITELYDSVELLKKDYPEYRGSGHIFLAKIIALLGLILFIINSISAAFSHKIIHLFTSEPEYWLTGTLILYSVSFYIMIFAAQLVMYWESNPYLGYNITLYSISLLSLALLSGAMILFAIFFELPEFYSNLFFLSALVSLAFSIIVFSIGSLLKALKERHLDD